MYEIPEELRYTQTHEWLKVMEPDEAVIGITAHAQRMLGDIVFLDCPKVGTQVVAGDELGVLESVKAAADYYAPISGVITDVNTKALEEPALINRDPYGEGWLVKIKANKPAEVDELLDAAQYKHATVEEA